MRVNRPQAVSAQHEAVPPSGLAMPRTLRQYRRAIVLWSVLALLFSQTVLATHLCGPDSEAGSMAAHAGHAGGDAGGHDNGLDGEAALLCTLHCSKADELRPVGKLPELPPPLLLADAFPTLAGSMAIRAGPIAHCAKRPAGAARKPRLVFCVLLL
jgi:hypothetical protein